MFHRCGIPFDFAFRCSFASRCSQARAGPHHETPFHNGSHDWSFFRCQRLLTHVCPNNFDQVLVGHFVCALIFISQKVFSQEQAFPCKSVFHFLCSYMIPTWIPCGSSVIPVGSYVDPSMDPCVHNYGLYCETHRIKNLPYFVTTQRIAKLRSTTDVTCRTSGANAPPGSQANASVHVKALTLRHADKANQCTSNKLTFVSTGELVQTP